MTQQTEKSRMHHVLILTDVMQGLPGWTVAAALFFDAMVAGACWLRHGVESSLIALALVLAFGAINWWLLRRLVTTGRNFGPDKPSAVALGALAGLLAGILGIVGVPLVIVLLILVALTTIAFYATWVEPFNIGVTHETYIVKAWTGKQPLRLLHIGDIHIERISPRERKLNALIEELKPDVIVFSGDYINLSNTDDEQTVADIREIIGAWHAPLGVYCVAGTPVVEPMERVLKFVEGLDNLTFLANRWTTIHTPGGDLQLLGMVTTHDLPVDRGALKRLINDAPEGGLAMLLIHTPEIAPEAAEAGFDLYLCGHTHGGQIRLPLVGPILTSSQLGRRFVMGRYQVDGMTLYVTRGIGFEGLGAPRARFLSPPEVVLWEIYGN